jgi:hypothetical protein
LIKPGSTSGPASIPYVKLGKYVRLQRSSLDAFIEAGRVPSE